MSQDSVRDHLMNADLRKGGNAAMAAITALQNFKPEEQLIGAAYTFLSYVKATKQHAPDVLSAVGNMAAEADGVRAEFKAVDRYLKTEILKDL